MITNNQKQSKNNSSGKQPLLWQSHFFVLLHHNKHCRKKHTEFNSSQYDNTYSNAVYAASTTTIPDDSSSAGDEVSSGSAISTGSSITGDEVRGVWISFLSYSSKGYTKQSFTNYVNTMFKKCKSKGYNTVFVHVRMFSDAMYPSKYFPWSVYSSGKAGKNPGFDPLKIMVDQCSFHESLDSCMA